MNEFTSAFSGIVVAIIGLAIVAVLVSQRANTAKVIGAAGSGLSGVISAAVSPVTGGSSGGLPTLNVLPTSLTNQTFGS